MLTIIQRLQKETTRQRLLNASFGTAKATKSWQQHAIATLQAYNNTKITESNNQTKTTKCKPQDKTSNPKKLISEERRKKQSDKDY